MSGGETEIGIGLVSVSDRAHAGEYADKGLPALKEWLGQALLGPWQAHERLVPDEMDQVATQLRELVDAQSCALVLTTGGTGPAARDITPEATMSVADRVLPGFGGQMRQASLAHVPTAILSRQVAVSRKQSLIINLPGQPKAIAQNLDAIFAAVPYCVELLGGPILTTNPERIVAFRPKSAKK